MSEKDKASYYINQAQAQFASQLVLAFVEIMDEIQPMIKALGSCEISRDEAIEAMKKIVAEKLDPLK